MKSCFTNRQQLFTFMGMPVTMVDLRLKWSLAREMHLSTSNLAGKQYTTEDAREESCARGREERVDMWREGGWVGGGRRGRGEWIGGGVENERE